MTNFFARSFLFLSRFFDCARVVGYAGAAKYFFWVRVWKTTGRTSVAVARTGRRFHFRGFADSGAFSYWFHPGYAVRDGHSTKRIRTIVDAGANIGIATARFRYYHPDAEIVALEPESKNFELLEANCGPHSKTDLRKNGLWSKTCRLKILPSDCNLSFRVDEVTDPNATADVEAVSIPDLMAQRGWDEIDILKMDIEGAERNVFTAADTSWLCRVNVLIFEVPDADSPGTTQLIYQKYTENGIAARTHYCGECLILIRDGIDWRFEVDHVLRRDGASS